MSEHRLVTAQRRADALPGDLSPNRLRSLCESTDVGDRLMALRWLQDQPRPSSIDQEHFDLAVRRTRDADNDCRWQALIAVGAFIETRPDWVWSVIDKYARSRDEDMRMGVAKVLLEHLLEQHWDVYVPAVLQGVHSDPEEFADTVRLCVVEELDSQKTRRLAQLVRNARRGLSPRDS